MDKDAYIKQLEKENAELKKRIEELERILRMNSASSWASLVLNATSQVSTSKSAVLFSGRELADADTPSKTTFASFWIRKPPTPMLA